MKHIPSLDGLRAWAVLFVLLHSNPIFHGFLFGVPFFFIISGFLITTILLESKYSFKMFIFRRLGRLLPASVVLISFTLMIYPLIPNGFDMPTLFGSIYALLFIVNYAQIFDLPHGWSGYFQHFWTLSLEIQFYMIIFFVLSVIDRREQMHDDPILFLIRDSKAKIIIFCLALSYVLSIY
jgi:peptidoglycan/LPS O-acetylase OafA/YrhL